MLRIGAPMDRHPFLERLFRRIVALRLDARGAWEIDLDNGVRVRLGRRQVDERFERLLIDRIAQQLVLAK